MRSQKSSEKINLDLYIYEMLNKSYSTKEIRNKLNISKQKLSYHMCRLKDNNIISKVSYGVWKINKQLTKKDFQRSPKNKKSKFLSIGTRDKPITNLHALQIKIPILEGKIKDKDWEVKEKLKNWCPKYTQLQELGGLRIKNNNNKSIIVWANEREVQNISEVHKITRAILLYLGSYFKNKHNVSLDTINAEVKNLDLATEDKNAESMRGKGEKFLLKLNKKCEKILKNDNRESKAWIDGSPFNFSAETNDTDWKREYLNMPFNIKHLIYSLPALEKYNRNLKLHIKVQEEQLKTQKEIQKLLMKLNNK